MKKACALLILPLLGTSAAWADQIAQSHNYAATPHFSQNLSFNKFDTSLGTLNSIYVAVSLATSGGALRIDNDAGTSSSGSVSFGAKVELTSLDVALLKAGFQPIANNVLAQGSSLLSLAADDGDAEAGGTTFFSYAGLDYGAYVPTTLTASDAAYVTNAVWGGYEGTGSFVLNVDGTQTQDYSALGGVQAQIDPISTSGTVSITYDYTPAPEPASLGLLGLGVLALIRRRA